MESESPPLPLTEAAALQALLALAHKQRLRTFRALVVAGPGGLTPGALAEQLGIAPSTLSFHLKELAHSGLAHAQPQGRNLLYRGDFARMGALLSYLTEHCCQGEACTPMATVDCSPAAREATP